MSPRASPEPAARPPDPAEIVAEIVKEAKLTRYLYVDVVSSGLQVERRGVAGGVLEPVRLFFSWCRDLGGLHVGHMDRVAPDPIEAWLSGPHMRARDPRYASRARELCALEASLSLSVHPWPCRGGVFSYGEDDRHAHLEPAARWHCEGLLLHVPTLLDDLTEAAQSWCKALESEPATRAMGTTSPGSRALAEQAIRGLLAGQ